MSLDLSLVSAVPTETFCRCSCGHAHTNMTRETFFDTNITHNLNTMFKEAGLYKILWHGDDLRAGDVLPKLEAGLAAMKAHPAHFLAFDTRSGWGTYAQAVPWLEEVIEACRKFPDAILKCDR